MSTSQGMAEYTKWAIKYPWHVSGPQQGQYPEKCGCQYCRRDRRKAKAKAKKEV